MSKLILILFYLFLNSCNIQCPSDIKIANDEPSENFDEERLSEDEKRDLLEKIKYFTHNSPAL